MQSQRGLVNSLMISYVSMCLEFSCALQVWHLSKVAYGKKNMTLLQDRGIVLLVGIQLPICLALKVSFENSYLEV